MSAKLLTQRTAIDATRGVIALSLLLATLSCDRMLTRPTQYSGVSVSVTRHNGDPIPGVSLELYTGQRPMDYGITGQDGKFTFERVPTGNYGVVATKLPDGYASLDELFGGAPTNFVSGLVVGPDTAPVAHLVFLKKGPGTISVDVTGVGSVPMAGIEVQLYSPQGTLAKANADSSGRVTFSNVPFGQYGIVVIRPYQYQGFYYRDFVIPRDSSYAVRDGILVEDGSRDSINVSLPTCTGTLRVSVMDQNGAPDLFAVGAFYTFDQVLAVLHMSADGHMTFTAPCAPPLGVNINPGQDYTVPDGRGSSFMDGITITNGRTVDLTFHVQRIR